MKVKFKITFVEFQELVSVIGELPYQSIVIPDIDFINLKSFYAFGLHKINSVRLSHNRTMKQISIDVNHYFAIQNVFGLLQNVISAYTLSIFLLIRSEVKPQIDRAATRNLSLRYGSQ